LRSPTQVETASFHSGDISAVLPGNLLNRVFIIFGEIGRDAQQPRTRPLNLIGDFVSKPLHDEQSKLRLVVHQPIEVVQALINDLLV
jgi:hypothetical protein